MTALAFAVPARMARLIFPALKELSETLETSPASGRRWMVAADFVVKVNVRFRDVGLLPTVGNEVSSTATSPHL